MAHVLSLTIVCAILFFPIGVCIHWLVLGEAARRQASPVAYLSGLAVLVLALSASRRAGIAVYTDAYHTVVLLIALVCIAAIYRRRPTLTTREFGWALLAFMSAVLFFQWPAFDSVGHQPVGSGAHSPLIHIAQTASVAHTKQYVGSAVVNRAQLALEDRSDGFEQFGGFMSSLAPSVWGPLVMHDLLLVFFASLVAIPIFVLARWRGIGWLGTTIALTLGVFSPIAMISIGFAESAGIAALPFSTCAILSIMIARRDRGWYAVAALHSAAAWMMVGVAALIPIAVAGGVWMVVAGRSKEHLKHTDRPVRADRPLVVGVLAIMFGVYGGLSQIMAGNGIEWSPLSSSIQDALLAWPYVWIGKSLETTVPSTAAGFAAWAAGLLLIGLAVQFAILRKDWRELAMVAGIASSVGLGAVLVVITGSSTALVEYSWLAGAPLLAVVVVRGFGLIRSESSKGWHQLRVVGPLTLLTTVGLLSVAAASTSGHRMTHQQSIPDLYSATSLNIARDPDGQISRNQKIAILSPSEWLAYRFGGDEIAVTNVDRYARNSGLVELPGRETSNYDLLVMNNDPFASEPPRRYVPTPVTDQSGNLSPVGFKLFSRLRPEKIDPASAQPSTEKAGEPTVVALVPTDDTPVKHDAAERGWLDENRLPKIGGLVVPPLADQCVSREACVPDVSSGDCTNADAEKLDTVSESATRLFEADLMTAAETIKKSSTQSPRTLGTADMSALEKSGTPAKSSNKDLKLINDSSACWDVTLDANGNTLDIHMKHIGLVLEPQMDSGGSEWSSAIRFGHTVATTTEENARIDFGKRSVKDAVYEVALEAQVASQGELRSLAAQPELASIIAPILPSEASWTTTFPYLELKGNPSFVNTGGGKTTVSRLVLRPIPDPQSCDLVVPAYKPGVYVYTTALSSGYVTLIVAPDSEALKYSPLKISNPNKPSSMANMADDSARVVTTPAKVRLTLKNTLSIQDLPRTEMVDYVEQYTGAKTLETCGSTPQNFHDLVAKDLKAKK